MWILPVGVSYRLESDLRDSVNTALDAIERQLDYCCNRDMDVAVRMRKAVANLLRSLSEHYNRRLPEEQLQHDQVKLLARDLVDGEDLPPPAGAQQHPWLHLGDSFVNAP